MKVHLAVGSRMNIPGAASAPAKTGNNVSAAVPLQRESTGVEVVLEASSGTVVVLNVVHATGSTLSEGDWLGSLLNGSGNGTEAADQSDQSSSELHLCGRVLEKRLKECMSIGLVIQGCDDLSEGKRASSRALIYMFDPRTSLTAMPRLNDMACVSLSQTSSSSPG